MLLRERDRLVGIKPLSLPSRRSNRDEIAVNAFGSTNIFPVITIIFSGIS